MNNEDLRDLVNEIWDKLETIKDMNLFQMAD